MLFELTKAVSNMIPESFSWHNLRVLLVPPDNSQPFITVHLHSFIFHGPTDLSIRNRNMPYLDRIRNDEKGNHTKVKNKTNKQKKGREALNHHSKII